MHECILYGFLPVVHPLDIEIAARQLYFALTDSDVDSAQIRTILIGPEDRLCPCVSDTVRPVEVFGHSYVVVDFILIDNPAVDNIRFIARRCIGRANDLDIMAVVGQSRDIRAMVRLDGGSRCICRRLIRFKVAVVVRCSRRPAHKRRQHRKCPPLIDTPLCAELTRVVDIISPCGIGTDCRSGMSRCSRVFYLFCLISRNEIGAVYRCPRRSRCTIS